MSALTDTMGGLGAALGKGAGEGLPQSKMLLDILKKLYKKNVDLVKENQILKQQLSSTKKRLIEVECAEKKSHNLKSSISKLQASVKSRGGAGARGKRGSAGAESVSGAASLQRKPLQKQTVLGPQVNAGKLVNELSNRLNQEQKQR